MRRGVVGRIGGALVVAVVAHAWVSAETARADDEPSEAVRIDYAAAATCPSREAFLAAVSARTTRMRIAAATERARKFVVVLEDAARGAGGRVTIRDRDGRELRREVNGASCEEVADVLALVVALAIDPHASLAPRASASASPAPTPASSASAIPPASTALPPSPSAAPPSPRPVPPSPERATRPRVRANDRTRGPSWATGAGASASGGVTPSLLFGPRVFVEVGASSDAWHAPRVRASFERTASGTVDVDGGGARFAWTVARADGCIAGWRASRVRVSPCIAFEAGTLEAEGTSIDHARGTTRPWLAIGPLARASWSFLEPFFIEIDVSLRASLVRSQFFFQPGVAVYDAPLVGGAAGLSLGLFF